MDAPSEFDYAEFDRLLAPCGPVAIVGQQLLKVAAISTDTIVFPPSYANPSEKNDDPPVYNIDRLDPSNPSKNVCVLDSIASQANRMEPLFGSPAYASLVPQYSVKLLDGVSPVSILNIGHRLADAVFRGTNLRDEIVTAFKEYGQGNAMGLARLGPTSLVFGAWDSRGTGVKVPRLINSIVRAFDVIQLKRSAQYSPPIKYEQEGLIPSGLEGKPADHGLADVPSTHKIGGVQVNGAIRRDLSLNMSALRSLKGTNMPETEKLQRYILGLALVALASTPESTFRQGCQLLPNGKPVWRQFLANGDEESWSPENLDLAEFAAAAARDFGVVQPLNQPLNFDKSLLKASIEADSKKKADKKASGESPIETLSRLVNALKVAANGRKLNEPPLKKLKDFIGETTEESVKAIAGLVQSIISGEDAPEEKIHKLKASVAKISAAEPAGSSETPAEAHATSEVRTQ